MLGFGVEAEEAEEFCPCFLREGIADEIIVAVTLGGFSFVEEGFGVAVGGDSVQLVLQIGKGLIVRRVVGDAIAVGIEGGDL